MKRTRTTNLDLSNVYGNKKSWYSDFETASLYAREESDGIHVYKAQRELVLFLINPPTATWSEFGTLLNH